MPSRKNCTPAVTTMSPAFNPLAMRTPSSDVPASATMVRRTTFLLGSTTKTAALLLLSVKAVRGTQHRWALILEAQGHGRRHP